MKKTPALWFWCVVCAAATAAGGVGSEVIGVGPPVHGARRAPALAVAPDGQVLVVWEEGTASTRVKGRIFETDLADPGPVVGMAPAPAVAPSVAWGPEGGFVVVWERKEEPGILDEPSAILARRFDRDARPVGAAIVLDEGAINFEVLEFFAPQVVSVGGLWAVVYRESWITVRFTFIPSLVGRLMLPNGKLVGRRVTLDSHCDIKGFKLAADPAIPEVVVVSQRSRCSRQDVLARRYDLQGNVKASTTVATGLSHRGEHTVDASVDALGRTAVVWVRTERFLPRHDIAGRRILADGSQRPGGRVPAMREERQGSPAVGVLADGHALVVWERSASRDDPPRLRGRWFDPNDRPVGDEFDLGNPLGLAQRRPVASVDRDGVIVAWEERLADGTRQIFLQRLEPGP